MSNSKRKWRKAGYISISKNQTCVTIKVDNQYYVAEIPEVLEVLTKKRGYASVFKPNV
ncbi:MAG: hypothetical protein QW734_05510 [Candidatus Bathyarchaeia archaeon]